jgi:hypothetical protein
MVGGCRGEQWDLKMEATGGWRKFHVEEFNYFYSS